MISFINSEIQKQIASLQSTISSLIETNIPKLNALLDSYSPIVDIQGTNLAINCALTQDPAVVNNQYVAELLTGQRAESTAAGYWRIRSVHRKQQRTCGRVCSRTALAHIPVRWSSRTCERLRYFAGSRWRRGSSICSIRWSVGLGLDIDTLSILLPGLDNMYGNEVPMNLKAYYDASLSVAAAFPLLISFP